MVQQAERVAPAAAAEPSLQEWRHLYEAAIRAKELAPWDWMNEVDIFGVENPETGDLGFVSVMGALGEHYAVGVYLGSWALYEFWSLVEAGPKAPPERILEIPQLQASFEDRTGLRVEDREIIKKLGLRFRGRGAWPLFRSWRPGFVPWYLEAHEARFLTTALLQLLDVAPRFREDRSLLEISDDDVYLVRALRREGGAQVWEDRRVQVPPPPPRQIEIILDQRLLQSLQKVTRSVAALEVDLSMIPEGMRDTPQERPYYAYNLLIVEPQSSFVLGTELLAPAPTLEAMWGQVPQRLAQQLLRVGILPEEIRVRSPLLRQLLQPLAQELGIRLKPVKSLRSLDSVQREMLSFLRR